MPIRAIVEIVLRVRDIDASLAFYRDTLGLDLFSPPGLPGSFLRVGDKDGIPMQVVLVPGAVTAPDGAPPAIKPRASTTSASKLTPPTGNLSATASRPPATPPATAPTHSCPSTPSTSTTPTATKSRSPQRAPEQGPRRALCIASGELPLRSPQPQPAPAQSDRAQGHSGRPARRPRRSTTRTPVRFRRRAALRHRGYAPDPARPRAYRLWRRGLAASTVVSNPLPSPGFRERSQ